MYKQLAVSDFPVLLHCPSVMENSVYDISEVGEDAMDFVASSFTEAQVCSSVHAGFFRCVRDDGAASRVHNEGAGVETQRTVLHPAACLTVVTTFICFQS